MGKSRMVEPVWAGRYRQRRYLQAMSSEAIAQFIRERPGSAYQVRAQTFDDAHEIEEELRALGLMAGRDGRIVTAHDATTLKEGDRATQPSRRFEDQIEPLQNAIDMSPQEDEWLPQIKAWVSESELRSQMEITSREVAQRALGVEGEPDKKTIMRIATCLRKLGYVPFQSGRKRLSVWKPSEKSPQKPPQESAQEP